MKFSLLYAFREGKWVTRTLLLLLALIMLLPVVITFLYSFFSPQEISDFMKTRGSMDPTQWMEVKLAPKMFSLNQYYEVLINDTTVLRMFVNSAFYTVAILLGQAVVIPMMAYALSRFKFRGREAIFFLILLLMILPFQVTMVPNVLSLRQMGF